MKSQYLSRVLKLRDFNNVFVYHVDGGCLGCGTTDSGMVDKEHEFAVKLQCKISSKPEKPRKSNYLQFKISLPPTASTHLTIHQASKLVMVYLNKNEAVSFREETAHMWFRFFVQVWMYDFVTDVENREKKCSSMLIKRLTCLYVCCMSESVAVWSFRRLGK